MLLGCIADDLTGATDLALTLKRGGMRVVQTVGVPDPGAALPADAVVVALKTRTAPVAEAVRQSLASAEVLLDSGAEQLFFKYCSTFDSTDEGNIGPVMDALLDRLGEGFTLACPAFPTNGRTVYRGHLFLGDRLLSESSMRDHPLTPMRDSDLVRLLSRQSRGPVGLIPFPVVDAGAAAIAAAFSEARSRGDRVVIVDALTDRHLRDIGAAAKRLRLVTGGSGAALGLPDNFRDKLSPSAAAGFAVDGAAGRPGVVLAGSCSAATRAQIRAALDNGHHGIRIDPERIVGGGERIDDLIEDIVSRCGAPPVIVYSSAEPAELAAVQERLGRDRAARIVEEAFAALASGLAARGYRRFVVAGGETSGAVVEGLGVRTLEIGPEIDPGVPWTRSLQPEGYYLALKSGNFGAADFFTKAWAALA